MKIIQFIFLRNNIPGIKKGGLVAQACHAAIAAIFTNRKNIDTIEYLKDLENMTKIVLKISYQQLVELIDFLDKNKYDYYKWVETPENVITCIALRPYKKENCLSLLNFISEYKLY